MVSECFDSLLCFLIFLVICRCVASMVAQGPCNGSRGLSAAGARSLVLKGWTPEVQVIFTVD